MPTSQITTSFRHAQGLSMFIAPIVVSAALAALLVFSATGKLR
ncbi:hypothetical protein [Actinomadura sp. 9N407]